MVITEVFGADTTLADVRTFIGRAVATGLDESTCKFSVEEFRDDTELKIRITLSETP